jgi:hypothetical protein
VVNKGADEITVTLAGDGEGIRFALGEDALALAPGAPRRVAVFAFAPVASARPQAIAVVLAEPGGERRRFRASSRFLTPR